MSLNGENKYNIKYNYFIYIIQLILIFIQIPPCYFQSCNKYNNILENSQCFNNIIIIDSSFYRAGHFAKNKNGDIVAEYSTDKDGLAHQRLFYCINKSGKYFYKEKDIVPINYNGHTYEGRYESTNLFVAIYSDVNKTKEYLMSLSSYKTLIEIYDIENNNIYREITERKFINGIFAFQFPIIELVINNKINYICIYTHDSSGNTYGDGRYYSIKRFYINENKEVIIMNSTRSNNANPSSRTIAGFLDENNFIYVIFLSDSNKISICKYDIVLNYISRQILVSYSFYYDDIFQSLYLKNNLAALIYFSGGYSTISVIFAVFKLDPSYQFIIGKSLNIDIFPGSESLNDLIKINDERLVFISAENNKLNFLFFDLYNNYNKIKIRYYSYSSNNYIFEKELAGHNYNDLLIFTITTSKDYNYNSLLMIFGYANGTDSEIDISPYLSDSDSYDINYNIINKLKEYLTIDNNIFQYEFINKIKLINIPEQLKFYNGNDPERELRNDDILEFNHNIKQNNELIKENNYYHFEYQFIIKEPEYDIFYSSSHQILSDDGDLSAYFIPQIFYGRTNTLKFKLCHQFCGSCKLYGISNDNQKCLSCLPEYQYDYYKITKTNCVPEGYFYDTEINKLIKCNETFVYKKDEEINKIFCFPYKEITTTIIPTTQNIIPTTHLIETTQNIIPTTHLISTTQNIIPTTNLIETTQNIIPTTNLIETTFLIETTHFKETTQVCTYNNFLNNLCRITNNTCTDILNEIIIDIIDTFPPSNGSSVILKCDGNNIVQITTDENEKNIIDNNEANTNGLSVLDLKECEEILREKNNISKKYSLIILKFEKRSKNINEKNIQYEIYHPLTKTKLDLSYCSNIDINIPLTLDEDQKNLYSNLKEKGYDLFNIKDPFYQDICTPYKTKDDTDILLADRQNDIYDKNLSCQNNCNYSSYSEKTQYLKCICEINNKNITLDEVKDIVYESFTAVLKYSNYQFLKCYKLVFHINSITKNCGSIILIILFIINLVILIIYIIKGIRPLKIEIIKINESKSYIKIEKKIKILKANKRVKNKIKNTKLNPPKKEIEKSGADYIIDFLRRRRNNKNNSSYAYNNYNNKNDKNDKNNTINSKQSTIELKTKDIIELNGGDKIELNGGDKIELNAKDKIEFKTKDKIRLNEKDKIEFKTKDKIELKGKNKLHKLNTEANPEFKLNTVDIDIIDDYELNNLNYQDALKLDKRSFIQIYCSMISKKHLIMFVFCSPNDYNLFYLKISKLIFLLATNFAINVLFFFDESMHKIYISAGRFNLLQQLPQIIYSSLVSGAIEYAVSYLILTEKEIHDIKKCKKTKKEGYLIYVSEVLNRIKIKFICYFVFSFSFMIFYWYFVSTFCAVYENTQIIFIKDVFTSFGLNLLYPFLQYMFFTLCRVIALKCKINSRICNLIYKLGVF